MSEAGEREMDKLANDINKLAKNLTAAKFHRVYIVNTRNGKVVAGMQDYEDIEQEFHEEGYKSPYSIMTHNQVVKKFGKVKWAKVPVGTFKGERHVSWLSNQYQEMVGQQFEAKDLTAYATYDFQVSKKGKTEIGFYASHKDVMAFKGFEMMVKKMEKDASQFGRVSDTVVYPEKGKMFIGVIADTGSADDRDAAYLQASESMGYEAS